MFLRSWMKLKNGQSKLSWWPLAVTFSLLVLLALAWLPIGDLLPEQRSNKPQLVVSYSEHDGSPLYSELTTELNQRLESRHEWRLREAPTDFSWLVTIGFEETAGQVILTAELAAPESAAIAPGKALQKIRVQAPTAAAIVLPEQLVKVLTEIIEAAATTTENQANTL